MRFLVDECAGPGLAQWLREQGHEVYSVFDEERGISDDVIIQKAYEENWILITIDKDFGTKIYRDQHPHCGVILLRLEDERLPVKILMIKRLLAQYADRLEDHYVVVTEKQVRIRRQLWQDKIGYYLNPLQYGNKLRVGARHFLECLAPDIHKLLNSRSLVSLETEQELATYTNLPKKLRPGESSCLAIALHRNWIFLTDDKAARNAAIQHKIQVSGTIGCLILSVERDILSLTTANQHLAQIIGLGYYAPFSSLDNFVQIFFNYVAKYH